MAVTLDLADIQGIVARGYGGLRHARFTLFACDNRAAARALLGWLLPRVTTAARRFSADCAVHVAFTPVGLRRLGLPEQAVAGFSLEFLAGMATPNRSRFLGDVGESDPHRWAWGGPDGSEIDGLILLYARRAELLTERQAELMQQLASAGARDVAVLDTLERQDSEPFGFRDGLSQPIVEGLPKASRGRRSVPAGEFVLGYQNGYGQLTDRPLLPRSEDPGQLLPPDRGGSGAADLGRNGTYLVLRQLEQDVDGFWRYIAGATRWPDGSDDTGAQEALAAKLVGRWRSGAPLVKAPYQDDPALATASLNVNALHRLIRRGRSYGPGAAYGPAGPTGLYFICLAASLSRQFEFVQHTWLNDPTFGGLYNDTDPIVGTRHPRGGTFTVPARPVRRRYRDLPQFVRTRGGAYFFLPGLSALRYLEQLPGSIPTGRRTE